MAPRLNWSTELRKIILKDALDHYYRHIHDKENSLQRLREVDFIPLPESVREDNGDEIAKTIYEELKRLIIHFFEEAFKAFKETKNAFYMTRIELHIKNGLNSIHELAGKLASGEIPEDLFVKEYKNTIKRLRRNILRDCDELFENYLKGHSYLATHLENLSLNLTGYLSICYAVKSIPDDLWKKKERGGGCFIRLYKHRKIGGKPVQLFFCECLSRSIDFFSGDYSHLDVFEHSKSLEIDRDFFCDIRDYIRTGGEKLLESIVSRIVERICSREDFFKGKGGLLTSFFKQLINTLKRIYSTPSGEPIDVSVDELMDLYDFLVLQNGILEYEVFRVVANSGYACLPKISVITIIDEEKGIREEREVDFFILGGYKIFLVEVSFRRDVEGYLEKLNTIINRLGESVSGFHFEKHIITKDNFKDFVNSLLAI